MATELSQDTLLYFLQSSGGSVKNSDLLLHFRYFIRDHADQNRNRELFKKFVNSLATVKQIDGVSYVVLRKKFKGAGGEESSSEPPRLSARKNSEPSPENAKLSPAWSAEKPRQKPREVTTPAPPGAIAGKTILPAAGIMLNNNSSNLEAHLKLNKKQQQVISTPGLSEKPAASAQVVNQISVSLSETFSPDQCTKAQNRVGFGMPPGITPAIKHHGETRQQPPVPETPRGREASLKPLGGLHQEPPLHPISLQLQAAPRYIRNRQSYKSAVSVDEDEEEEEEEEVQIRQCAAGVEQPLSTPLRDVERVISASSPCILDPPVCPSVVSSSSSSSSERKLPKIYVQDMERETMTPHGPGWSLESGVGQKGPWAGSRLESGSVSGVSTRQSLPLEAERVIASPDQATEVGPHHDAHADRRYSQPAGVQLDPSQGLDQSQGEWLSSSHSTIFSPSSDADPSNSNYPSPRGFGWNSSYEDLHTRAGDIYGRDEAESSAGSASSPPLGLQSPVARRLSSRLRGRMSRSLGADLDQLLQEESRAAGGSEAARLNRLHLISSSLSLRYNVSSSSLSSCSTPPRCQSLAELDEGVKRRGGRRSSPITTSSTARHEGPSRQSMVPLEPREHAWLVKGAAGAWPDIYTLFREDSSLLNRQDFISGFTVLHWIAKHGDHRVLNTLWYGVEKAGLTFNINAKSTCGHTPLHIAAIHDNKNIMRLLVNKFNADVKLRDTSGKKAWQYLSGTAQPDVFQLLGAPLRPAGEGDGGVVREDQVQRSQTPRRRRHHLSFASLGERPPAMSGTTRVKRSTSIAAFLKHRSLQPFHGHQSDSSV
ncbi:ankyrin repeat domain-containing protein SOWAHB-like [Etheostoma cragini]|uniref:ankyrin repeat domain-containing protein SOWAHB-like n=1 Tax=Etheostoma cragini TaxID=417921 RepID=UPI00155F44F4|nr:ankyrin repeat domain-containing protein SOWAHB-like [Etheostoma cragini]